MFPLNKESMLVVLFGRNHTFIERKKIVFGWWLNVVILLLLVIVFLQKKTISRQHKENWWVNSTEGNFLILIWIFIWRWSGMATNIEEEMGWRTKGQNREGKITTKASRRVWKSQGGRSSKIGRIAETARKKSVSQRQLYTNSCIVFQGGRATTGRRRTEATRTACGTEEATAKWTRNNWPNRLHNSTSNSRRDLSAW